MVRIEVQRPRFSANSGPGRVRAVSSSAASEAAAARPCGASTSAEMCELPRFSEVHSVARAWFENAAVAHGH